MFLVSTPRKEEDPFIIAQSAFRVYIWIKDRSDPRRKVSANPFVNRSNETIETKHCEFFEFLQLLL